MPSPQRSTPWTPSSSGSWASERAARVLALALLAALLLAAPAARAETRVALVIGNAAYASLEPLRNPVNDATDIAEALEALDFEVMRGNDLGRAEMIAHVAAFAEAAREAGRVALLLRRARVPDRRRELPRPRGRGVPAARGRGRAHLGARTHHRGARGRGRNPPRLPRRLPRQPGGLPARRGARELARRAGADRGRGGLPLRFLPPSPTTWPSTGSAGTATSRARCSATFTPRART